MGTSAGISSSDSSCPPAWAFAGPAAGVASGAAAFWGAGEFSSVAWAVSVAFFSFFLCFFSRRLASFSFFFRSNAYRPENKRQPQPGAGAADQARGHCPALCPVLPKELEPPTLSNNPLASVPTPTGHVGSPTCQPLGTGQPFPGTASCKAMCQLPSPESQLHQAATQGLEQYDRWQDPCLDLGSMLGIPQPLPSVARGAVNAGFPGAPPAQEAAARPLPRAALTFRCFFSS